MLHVVSTGLAAPTREKCILSVRSQKPDVMHHYIESEPTVDVITNMGTMISCLDPEDVVIWLDGDDWMVRDDACAIVKAMHDAGAWVTWGSFEFSDGRKGFAAPVNPALPIRQQPWVTTHLKTFRAGLFQRITDLTWPPGAQVPWDMLVMFAVIEMAGYDRCSFCPTVLSAYNFASSNEFKNGPGEERRIEQTLRARDPYPRVETL